jgi:hypothetical protein
MVGLNSPHLETYDDLETHEQRAAVMTAINEKLLEDRLGTLEAARSWSPRVVSRLEALIRSGADDALFRINPIKFAADKGMAEAEAVELFLYATAHGLFEMNWMLLCSQCGCVLAGRTPRRTRRDLPHRGGVCRARGR